MTPSHLLRPSLAAVAMLASTLVLAQTTLQPPAARITDGTISADQRSHETTQARIKALNDGGRPVRDYHLAKAQCWLDVSFHELTRNDRGPFPQAALNESVALIQAMEARRNPLPMDTPLVAGAERLRPDLWQRAQALRGHVGWQCAAAKAACAEVELVHAGHEHQQIGWRHAKPYVQLAEDLVSEAETLAQQCLPPTPAPAPPPAPSPTPSPAPVVATPPPAPPLALSVQVVFRFDRHQLADITPASLATLQSLVDRIRNERLVVQYVDLAGHADRLNATGERDYNLRLSERRVATVRSFLVERGIDAARIGTRALGDTQQVQACPGNNPRAGALQDCLLPNRRVEVTLTATRP